MFNWVLNTRLSEILQNSCYLKSFMESLKNICE